MSSTATSTPSEVAENILDPAPGTALKDFQNDNNQTKRRDAGDTIRRMSQLGAYERHELNNHIRSWVKVFYRKKLHAWKIRINKQQRRQFFQAISDGWSSDRDPADLDISPPKRNKKDTRTRVRVWGRDLPPSKRQREDDDDDNDDEPPQTNKKAKSTGSKRRSVRLAGQPSYLCLGVYVGKGECKLSFNYKDESSQMATDQFIVWESQRGYAAEKAKCLIKWEDNECTRISRHNRDINSARNHIIKLADAGYQAGQQRIANPTLPELLEPVSAWKLLQDEIAQLTEVFL
ncbi:hypothetical protein ACHAPJ_003027 [Fusarium lateritium]